jgi:hypothetical protein
MWLSFLALRALHMSSIRRKIAVPAAASVMAAAQSVQSAAALLRFCPKRPASGARRSVSRMQSQPHNGLAT